MEYGQMESRVQPVGPHRFYVFINGAVAPHRFAIWRAGQADRQLLEEYLHCVEDRRSLRLPAPESALDHRQTLYTLLNAEMWRALAVRGQRGNVPADERDRFLDALCLAEELGYDTERHQRLYSLASGQNVTSDEVAQNMKFLSGNHYPSLDEILNRARPENVILFEDLRPTGT